MKVNPTVYVYMPSTALLPVCSLLGGSKSVGKDLLEGPRLSCVLWGKEGASGSLLIEGEVLVGQHTPILASAVWVGCG